MKAFQSKVLLMAMGLAPLSGQASGFALIEQSASAQGLSYAGAAAFAEDASIMWFNPAGLTKIENNQLIAAGHVIKPSAQFSNDGSYILTEDNLITGANDDGAQTSFVPNFYWKGQYQEIDVGLGINVPFGSTVEYDQDWAGRYHAVYTATKTVNINPAFAVKLHPQVSFGAGLNIQYIDVNLTQKVDLGDQENDGYVDLQADGIGYGFNFGFLYDLDNGANIGLSYRSQIKHHAPGDAYFTARPYKDQGIESTVTLPASASLSIAYPFNDKINILADVTWTGWSSFDELRIEFDNK
ncbi:long-chain fatty acid transport protein [uncultured Thiomicrorhabdus sp.]